MGKRFRIGNDIRIEWTLIDKEGQPYVPAPGSRVVLCSGINTKEIEDYSVDGNTVKFVFYGKDQCWAGCYSLLIVEHKGERDMVTFDVPSVFHLVHHSWQTGGEDSDRIKTETVTLTSAVEIPGIPGPPGKSAYQIAVDNGFIGTEEEWIASLKGEKGDPGSSTITKESIETALGYTPYEKPTGGIPPDDFAALRLQFLPTYEMDEELPADVFSQGVCPLGELVKSAQGNYLLALVAADETRGLYHIEGEYILRGNAVALSVTVHAEGFDVRFATAYLLTQCPQTVRVTRADKRRVTTAEINAWNNKYTKPASGIPKSDMAEDVQASLNKANSALQSYTETDPTVPAWAKAPAKPTYTAQEVGALPEDTVIPAVPAISTSIAADAASDAKTASPKAVKTYVDGIVGNIESLLAAI